MTKTQVVGLIAAALAARWGPEARACAGLVHAVDDLAESDHAEVVFEVAGDQVAVSYLASYVGDAAAFGWVIPVPSREVAAVEDGDPSLFERLRAASAPAIEWGEEEAAAGCGLGCLAGASKGGDLAGGTRGTQNVTVLDQGFTGTFDYVVVASDDAADLQAWFVENGWEGLPADDLQHYVDVGGAFVALSLTPDITTTPAEGAPLPPLRVRYAGGGLRFPSVMARHGAVDAQRTTAYVVADARAVLAEGWTSEDGGVLRAPDVDPEVAFLARLGGLGEDRAWLRSWAAPFADGAGADRFATRFDTWAPTDVHDVDAVFDVEASTEPLSTTVDVSSDDERAAGGGLALLGLLGWGLRRRGAVRSAGTAARR